MNNIEKVNNPSEQPLNQRPFGSVDKDTVLEVIKTRGDVFEALSRAKDEVKSDKELVREAMQIMPNVFTCASEELRGDKELVLEALELYRKSGFYFHIDAVSESLRSDGEFMLEIMKLNKSVIWGASENLKNDKDFMLKAIKIDGHAFLVLPESLQNDVDLRNETVKWGEDHGGNIVRDLEDKKIEKAIVQVFDQHIHELVSDKTTKEKVLTLLKDAGIDTTELSVGVTFRKNQGYGGDAPGYGIAGHADNITINISKGTFKGKKGDDLRTIYSQTIWE